MIRDIIISVIGCDANVIEVMRECVADGLRPAVRLHLKIHVSSVTRVFVHYTTTMLAERRSPICVLIHIQISDISNSSTCDCRPLSLFFW